MITPKLNINGSSLHDLTNPRQRAHGILAEAIEVLQQATPNGRDYPDDPARCLTDRELHYARITSLRHLQAELLNEALDIRYQED
jgi:hypothetical protein